jgi:hypothetical protein
MGLSGASVGPQWGLTEPGNTSSGLFGVSGWEQNFHGGWAQSEWGSWCNFLPLAWVVAGARWWFVCAVRNPHRHRALNTTDTGTRAHPAPVPIQG